nr:IVa2 [Psittacine siadenovirus F]
MNLEQFFEQSLKWKKAVDEMNSSILPDCTIPSFKEFESYETNIDLRDDLRRYNEINTINQKYLRNNELPYLNMGDTPLISLIIGPTGCGKSQLLRNIIGYKKLSPPPESVIFITPSKGMLSQDELLLWKTQLQEGNYSFHENIYPTTNVFKVDFIELSFDEAITPENIDPNNEKSVFSVCCKKGPTCVILDECMQKLIQKGNISPLFCSLPSKLYSKFCNAFYMFVVLHNVNPISGNGNNIMDLKSQTRLHILSTKNQPLQISNFVHNRSGGMNSIIRTVLINSIISEKNSNFSFVMFNTCPKRESFQWSAILDGGREIIPLCVNLQSLMLNSVVKICNVCVNKIKNQKKYQKDKRRKIQQQ